MPTVWSYGSIFLTEVQSSDDFSFCQVDIALSSMGGDTLSTYWVTNQWGEKFLFHPVKYSHGAGERSYPHLSHPQRRSSYPPLHGSWFTESGSFLKTCSKSWLILPVHGNDILLSKGGQNKIAETTGHAPGQTEVSPSTELREEVSVFSRRAQEGRK